MKKISLFLILAATITSACGQSENEILPCPDLKPKEFLLSESYACASGCDDVCKFDNLSFFETKDSECGFLTPNFSNADILCSTEDGCPKTDFKNISVAWHYEDSFVCEGEEQDDGVHLRCVKNPSTANSIDCQEAIFQKNE